MKTLCRSTFWLVSFLFLVFLHCNAFALTLTDTSSGLTLTVPKGYTLKNKNGVYTLQGKKSFARFILARSPLALADTVKSYIKFAKIKNATTRKKGSTIQVTGQLGKRLVLVNFKSIGSLTEIVTYGSGKLKSAAAIARTTSFKTSSAVGGIINIEDIAILQRALNSRQGGATLPLNVTIPMKRFTAPDGGSSALVPDLPGWSYQGGGGVITGANATQGIISLGIPVGVSLPNPFGLFVPPPNSQTVLPPDQAIINVWPQYVSVTSGAQVQVLNLQVVPGTEGYLGSNAGSALFGIRFLLNGRPWVGMFSSGSNIIPGLDLAWYWYHSYIAVPEDGPGGIGAALLNTWSSWDNSGASQARLNQALQTLLSIRTTGGPIDPEVFQVAANAWSDYIRE